MTEIIAARLEANSVPVTECGCQIWLGATTPAGYGALRVNGKVEYAHRLAWRLKNGEIPEGLFICHRCDVRCCINPDHLFVGTDLDNIADMVAKRRHKPPPIRRKIDPATALAIASASGSNREIGRQFGVTHSTVARVKRDTRGYVFVEPSARMAAQ